MVSAVGIAAATLLTWVVTRPIIELKQAAEAVGQGDFQQYVIPWAQGMKLVNWPKRLTP